MALSFYSFITGSRWMTTNFCIFTAFVTITEKNSFNSFKCFLPWDSTRFQFIGDIDVIRPYIKLPLSKSQNPTQYCARVNAYSHWKLHLKWNELLIKVSSLIWFAPTFTPIQLSSKIKSSFHVAAHSASTTINVYFLYIIRRKILISIDFCYVFRQQYFATQ